MKTSIEQLYNLFKQHPLVTTDSRHCPASSLFFALKGERFDGNQFAGACLEKGCAYAIVDDASVVRDERYLLVEDVLSTLQDLARYHRQQLSAIPVIAITGTNGKTTTKELCAAVLSKRYHLLYTQGNLNNHIGVPLTLLQLTEDHEIAIIEMGANHPGEIKTLVEIAQPDYGIITNIGTAHLEGFGSFEGVRRTKGELYDYLREHNGLAFYLDNNDLLQTMSEGMKRIAYRQVEDWSEASSRQVVCGKICQHGGFLQFDWQADDNLHHVQTQLVGGYNLSNALAALSVGRHFHVEDADMTQALEAYCPGNHRSQWIDTQRNRLVVDAYNANPSSMHFALDDFEQQTASQKVLILGAMKELGEYSQTEHRRLLDRLVTYRAEKVLLIGKEYQQAASPVHRTEKFHYFDQTEDALSYLQTHPLQDCLILLKGSRSNRLESLIPSL